MRNTVKIDPYAILDKQGKEIGHRPTPLTDEEYRWNLQHCYTEEERKNEQDFQDWLDSLSEKEAQELFDLMDKTDREIYGEEELNKQRPHVMYALIRYDKDNHREVYYYDREADALNDYEDCVKSGYIYVAVNRLNRDYTEDTLQYHEEMEA